MAYGTIKVDNITFTDNSVDKTVSLSGLIQNPTFTGNVTATGTISGDVIRGGTTISGLTVTGTTANFVSGVFTTQVSGATITGTTVATTTGSFVSLTGTTATFTSGIIASGTAALPSLAILSDPNTGIYSPGADQLAISTGGTSRLAVSTTAVSSTLAVDHPLGAVGTPSITFTGDLNTGIWSPAADTIAFSKGGAEAMRIDSSARLLVGVSTSDTVLSAAFQIAGLGFGGTQLITRHSGTGTTEASALFLARTRGSSASSRTIVSNGDDLGQLGFVGADGSTLLTAATIVATVDGTPGANDMPARLVFSTTADGAASPTERMRIDSAGTTTLTSAASTAPFIAKISSTEVARIDSSGRLLVGTSSTVANVYNGPNAGQQPLLQVRTTTNNNNTGATFLNNSANGYAPIVTLGLSKSNTAASNTVVIADNELGYLQFVGNDGTNFRTAAWIAAFVDGTPGTNDMPGRLVFSTTADGAASPTERMRIDSTGLVTLAGPGIKFPATQVASADANTLDDYEEGSWTPTFAPSSGSFTTMTVSVQGARYVKIGQQVTVSAYFFTTAVDATGASGSVSISGLPFTTRSTQVVRYGAALGYTAGFNSKPIVAYIVDNSTTIELLESTTDNDFLDVADLNTTAGNKNFIQVTATYFVN